MKRILRFLILRYLRFFARIKVSQVRDLRIVGVTGSAGKTSAVDAIALILEKQYRVKKTYKANSETGIPLDILGLHMKNYSLFDWLRVLVLAPVRMITYPFNYQYYVMELGVDKPGDMAYLMTIVQPIIGVFLNVGTVHAQAFGEGKDIQQKIAMDKAVLLQQLPREGTAIINEDDPFISESVEDIACKKIFFGKKDDTNDASTGKQQYLLFDKLVSNDKGFSMEVWWNDHPHTVVVSDLVLGNHFAYTFAAAVAVGIAADIPVSSCAASLKQYTLPKGRGSILKGIKDTTLIDSSYNSSPEALIAMIDVLKTFPQKRKILVLGDMRELGSLAQQKHREVVPHALDIADEIVVVGHLMKDYFLPEAQKQGFDPTKLHFFLSSKEVGAFMKEKVLKGGEAILFKGSQNTIFLERVVKDLMLHPDLAPTVLCRQDGFWEKKRAAC